MLPLVAAILLQAAAGAQPPAASPAQPPAAQSPAPVPPLQAAPAAEPPPVPPGPPQARVIGAKAAIFFYSVRPASTATFEAAMTRARNALKGSKDPDRQKQADGWQVFKATEPFQGATLYAVIIDPAVPGADYAIARILAEHAPGQAQSLFPKFLDSLAAAPSMLPLIPILPRTTPR